ncbi:hypothetical protein II5_05948 [Bacillus cereus MSX-A1]|nr:hypothetical protein II5_05948 [Bacillus cereus MSX-A1]
MTATLRKMGLCVNHKKVLRIMRQNHILSKVRRKKKKYINGAEPMVAPHRLERQFDASKPNEKWFTDVTYLLFGERALYVSTIMDAFNREIISCVISMSRRGNCHDNAVTESFFDHLKSEAFYSQEITKVSNTTVRKIVLEYIYYYNCVRIQEKLNHLSPKEFREQVV